MAEKLTPAAVANIDQHEAAGQVILDHLVRVYRKTAVERGRTATLARLFDQTALEAELFLEPEELPFAYDVVRHALTVAVCHLAESSDGA